MTRKRLTWSSKTASPPPADPGYEEASVHPAAYPDPGPDDYKNGDTSSWAEDPHPGPYPNTLHPALPGTEEPQGHPATDKAHYFPAGVSKQAAAQLRAAMEVKAAKCIRIAQSMLGKVASVAMVEDQALDLMNLTDRQIQAALARIAGEEGEEEPAKEEEPKEEKKAEEEAPEAEDEETAGKKAARFQRLAAYWTGVAKKAGEIPEALKEHQFGKKEDDKKEEPKEDKKASRKATSMPGNQNDPAHYNYRARGVLADELEALEEDDEDEALLAEMLKEECNKSAAEDDEDEALLAEMEAEEAKKAAEEPQAKKEEVKEEPKKEAGLDPEEEALLAGMLAGEDEPEAVNACGEEPGLDDLGDLTVEEDPMGLMDDTGEDLMTDDELSALYGSKFAGEEEVVEEVKEEKKASAKPSAKVAQRPQPRAASNGVRTLGGSPRVASSDESDKLSSLWESAPDVSKIFGV